MLRGSRLRDIRFNTNNVILYLPTVYQKSSSYSQRVMQRESGIIQIWEHGDFLLTVPVSILTDKG